jgi:hypothetical protein
MFSSADNTMYSANDDSGHSTEHTFDLAESDIERDIESVLNDTEFDELQEIEHFIETLQNGSS